jgi:hypothetical protein
MAARWAMLCERPFVQRLIVGLVALALYLASLAAVHDSNGVLEAAAIEEGGSALFNPNHLAYRPAVFVLYDVILDRGVRAIVLVQAVGALASALGVAAFYTLLFELTRSRPVSTLLSLLFATSWAMWHLATNGTYFSPSIPLVLIATSMILRSRHSVGVAMAAGLVGGLAVLVWKGHLFFVVSAAVAWWLVGELDARRRLERSVAFLAFAGSITLLAYASVAILVFQHRQIGEFLAWTSSYEGRLPQWGQWAWDRLPRAAETQLASVLPVWDGLGLRDLWRGSPSADKLLRQLSLLALVWLLLPAGLWATRLSGRACLPRCRDLQVLALLYAGYLPFVIWWDPFEPRWFIVPTAFLLAGLGLFWSALQPGTRSLLSGYLAALTIAASVLTAHILPNANRRDPRLLHQACIGERLEPTDTFATLDWGEASDVGYFYGRNVISIIRQVALVGKVETWAMLERTRQERAGSGGRLVTKAPDQYTPAERSWLSDQLGLSDEDFARLRGAPIFDCQGTSFVAVGQPS